MKFGMALPVVHQMPGQPAWQRGDDVSPIVAVAKKADELGYAWLPCSDHLVVTERALPFMGDQWYDPATTLAFIAGQTERIRLLSHVLVLPYHSPFDVAKQYATLDRLSGGRVILGVGAGHQRGEFRALGAPYEDRGAVTDERIRAIKALWGEQPASFDGAYHTFENVHLGPRPVQQPHPPIWVGGNSRRAVRRAVELGDGWIPFELTVEELRDRVAYARSLGGRRLEVALPTPTVALADAPIDGERAPFSGSAEQIADDIETLADAGVTGVTVGFRAGSLSEQLELIERFARDVMPAFA